MTPVSVKPAAPQSRVKHSTTEPLCSLFFCYTLLTKGLRSDIKATFCVRKIVNIFLPINLNKSKKNSKDQEMIQSRFRFRVIQTILLSIHNICFGLNRIKTNYALISGSLHYASKRGYLR